MSEEHSGAVQPTSIADLHPKMQLQGVVRKVALYGAHVDIGLERDGLVHISQLSDRRVDRVSDVVKEGDRVTVWVTQVDPEQGRIGLTMVQPPAVEWREMEVGQTYTGRVVRLERYGVFVDIGAERPGLLHSREMGDRVFGSPSDLFHMGDEVEVRILALDRRKKRIDLTMEDRAGVSADDLEEEDEAPQSSIEIAFRRAQGEKTRRSKKRSEAGKRRLPDEQEDILSRTLEWRGR